MFAFAYICKFKQNTLSIFLSWDINIKSLLHLMSWSQGTKISIAVLEAQGNFQNTWYKTMEIYRVNIGKSV